MVLPLFDSSDSEIIYLMKQKMSSTSSLSLLEV